MMIDHVLHFSDEAAAQAMLPLYAPDGVWNGSCVIPNLTVEVSGTPLPGFWVCVSLVALNQDLIAVPGNALRFAVDETGAFVYQAPDFNAALVANALVYPTFSGRNYKFGADRT